MNDLSPIPPVSLHDVEHVRDNCLCLASQRAARMLARRFDAAFQPLGLTNGQFSLMMMLNAVAAPKMGEVAAFLAMDRTTLTAALKSLERRGLVVTARDEKDRRGKRLSLTDAGRALLAQALPIWTREHATLETSRPQLDGDRLRAQLRALF